MCNILFQVLIKGIILFWIAFSESMELEMLKLSELSDIYAALLEATFSSLTALSRYLSTLAILHLVDTLTF